MPNTVIVIDPGHGGENEGALWEEYIEKEINMKVATSMKEELEKYENVTVYLTHIDDVDMSLKERAEFAKAVNADFLACLHFNMSEYHTLYGTECWISAFGDCYAKGYDFAKIQNELLVAEGLHNRGVKTKLGKTGDDYYGLIRHSTQRGIPSCIIEHCHLDRIEDAPFVNTDTWLERYGKIDATAIAKYFGLKSEILGVDYSEKTFEPTVVPDKVMGQDKTEPEECLILSVSYSTESDSIIAEVSAKESDSILCYYTYSTDGGETFSELKSWENMATQMTILIPMPEYNKGELIIRAHNNYDLIKSSEPIDITHLFVLKEQYEQIKLQEAQNQLQEEQATQAILQFTEEVPLSPSNEKANFSWGYGLVVAVLIPLLIELVFIRRKLKRRSR